MAILERDVLLMGRDGGRNTMDFPITRLGNVEDTAPVKEEPEEGDLLPLIDSADSGQMKKTTVRALVAPFEAAVQEALKTAVNEAQLNEVIQTAVQGVLDEVEAITNEEIEAKQDKLTGQPGQVVGFGEDGTPQAQAALTMDEVNAAIDEAVAGAIEEVY